MRDGGWRMLPPPISIFRPPEADLVEVAGVSCNFTIIL